MLKLKLKIKTTKKGPCHQLQTTNPNHQFMSVDVLARIILWTAWDGFASAAPWNHIPPLGLKRCFCFDLYLVPVNFHFWHLMTGQDFCQQCLLQVEWDNNQEKNYELPVGWGWTVWRQGCKTRAFSRPQPTLPMRDQHPQKSYMSALILRLGTLNEGGAGNLPVWRTIDSCQVVWQLGLLEFFLLSLLLLLLLLLPTVCARFENFCDKGSDDVRYSFYLKRTLTILMKCCFAVFFVISADRFVVCQGRVAQSVDKGVMVDVGAYTERGEWVDGFLHMGQIKDDGGYVAQAPRSRFNSDDDYCHSRSIDPMIQLIIPGSQCFPFNRPAGPGYQGKIMDFVHLGEFVRVRVVECVPATGILRLSMRAEEDTWLFIYSNTLVCLWWIQNPDEMRTEVFIYILEWNPRAKITQDFRAAWNVPCVLFSWGSSWTILGQTKTIQCPWPWEGHAGDLTYRWVLEMNEVAPPWEILIISSEHSTFFFQPFFCVYFVSRWLESFDESGTSGLWLTLEQIV